MKTKYQKYKIWKVWALLCTKMIVKGFLDVFPELKTLINWKHTLVAHQMAVPVPSISCCVLIHNNLFYQIQNALAFN